MAGGWVEAVNIYNVSLNITASKLFILSRKLCMKYVSGKREGVCLMDQY